MNINIYDLRRYASDNFEVSAYFYRNSMDKVFFPTKGTHAKARIARTLYHRVNVERIESIAENVSGETNGFTKLSVDFERRIPLKKSLSLILGATAGLTLVDAQQSNKISFLENGKGAQYNLGGNLNINRRDSYSFHGLGDAELIVTQFVKTNLGLLINPAHNIYIKPYMNIASVGFDNTEVFIDNIFSLDANWTNTTETSTLFSAGSTFSYHSILGPVNFDIAYMNNVKKIPIFFSVGLQLNIPD